MCCPYPTTCSECTDITSVQAASLPALHGAIYVSIYMHAHEIVCAAAIGRRVDMVPFSARASSTYLPVWTVHQL